jgi:hypothetical protein
LPRRPWPRWPGKDGDIFGRDGGCAWLDGTEYLIGGDAGSSNGTINGISDFTLA